jgi:GT2 family glycosyltransferase
MVYTPKVSIIVLNYNGGKYLKECLDSVLRTDYHNIEVIVVDNASDDGSPEFVKKHYPQVILIENEKNLGFCEGNNIGIRKATGEIIILLNNDTIVDSKWIKEILKKAEDPKVGIVGCRLYFPGSKIIQSLGFRMRFLGYWESIGAGQIDNGQFDEIRDVDFVSGAALAIKREVIKKIGLFDSEFYAYNEDKDLCYRARKAGYRVITSNAVVYHYGSMSWDRFQIKKIYLNNRNLLRFVIKHYSPKALLRFTFEYPIKSLKLDLIKFLLSETVSQRVTVQNHQTKKIFIQIRNKIFSIILFFVALLSAIMPFKNQNMISK